MNVVRRGWRSWSFEELTLLRHMARRHANPRTIAIAVGRSIASVQAKARAEGIILHAFARPRHRRAPKPPSRD